MTDSELHPYVELDRPRGAAAGRHRPGRPRAHHGGRSRRAVPGSPLRQFWSRLVRATGVHTVASHGRSARCRSRWNRRSRQRFRLNRDGQSAAGRPSGALCSSSRFLIPLSVSSSSRLAPRTSRSSAISTVGTRRRPRCSRTSNSGLWTVTLPLSAGRHICTVRRRRTWSARPTCTPVAGDDGFGHANSVRLVPKGSSL